MTNIQLPTQGSPAVKISGTDEFFRAVVAEAELPALLPALAHATGDFRLVDPALSPPTGKAIPAVSPPQGGMTPAQQERARELALEALQRLRDTDVEPLDVTDDEQLLPLVRFISGDGDVQNLPLVHHELNFALDSGDPGWSIEEIAPHRVHEFTAVVIGAGPQGIQAAHRLKQAGLEVTIYEKNDAVGGTWYENSYPGCRLDTPNFTYSYSFLQKKTWPQAFLEQKHLHQYFDEAATVLGVRELVQFNSEVEEVRFNEETLQWHVTARGPEGLTERTAAVVISAVGQLNRPNIPEIPGAESFLGEQWHTTAWPEGADLSGKRVAVIGTGATGFQVIPTIAPEVEHLTVFQRTPPWMYPAANYHDPIPEGMHWLLENLPYFHRWYRFLQFYTNLEGRIRFMEYDKDWEHPVSSSAANEELRQDLAAYIQSEFADHPDLLQHVLPAYPPGAKRMLRDNGIWAKTLKSPHVDLVTNSIDRITPDGIVDKKGNLHRVDVIVYGTGFKASDFLFPMTVIGRDGMNLHEEWGGDVQAYYGVNIPRFPNLFLLYGPNTNLVVNGSLIFLQEMGVEFIMSQIQLVLDTDSSSIEIKNEPFEGYNRWLDEGNARMSWSDTKANSWYRSSKSGRSSQNWPFTMLDYWKGTHTWDASLFNLK
jgi:4-hydroxyacetophenone monooxygenase